MTDRLPTKKYTISVEGETEMWYFDWLEKQINACKERTYNASIDVNVQQSPKKFYKRLNAKTAARVIHVCDMESNDPVHVDKFKRILSEMNEAKKQKKITYMLGYSNFTFELWMVLHKQDCNSSFNHHAPVLKKIAHYLI